MISDLPLGELQALVTKAARGGGRSVGLAQDAGRAARWLCAHGADGAGALVGLLVSTDGVPHAALRPDGMDGLRADGGPVCALVLGAMISDLGAVPTALLGPVLAPLVLLPALADVADVTGQGISMQVGDAEISLGPDGAVRGTLRLPDTAKVVLRFGADPVPKPAALVTRAQVTPPQLGLLNTLAARTYAPATEASRASGAGAGLSDND